MELVIIPIFMTHRPTAMPLENFTTLLRFSNKSGFPLTKDIGRYLIREVGRTWRLGRPLDPWLKLGINSYFDVRKVMMDDLIKESEKPALQAREGNAHVKNLVLYTLRCHKRL